MPQGKQATTLQTKLHGKYSIMDFDTVQKSHNFNLAITQDENKNKNTNKNKNEIITTQSQVFELVHSNWKNAKRSRLRSFFFLQITATKSHSNGFHNRQTQL